MYVKPGFMSCKLHNSTFTILSPFSLYRSSARLFALRPASERWDRTRRCRPDHTRCIHVFARRCSIRQGVGSNVFSRKMFPAEPLH